MTNHESADCVYWIWFQLVFGIGTRRAELFMNYFDNPKQIFDGIKLRNRVSGMLEEKELIKSDAAFIEAEGIKRRTLKKGVDIITPEDNAYPALLSQIYSKPAVLYVKGDLSGMNGRLAIAMVGSRKYSEYGKEASAWIAKGLARGGAVVVSGLAHGIDTECHRAALQAGGKSIGIMGCGIDVDYPKGNADLKRMISENGAVVTEYPLKTEPKAMNFPIRNRIVSGMCHGVVVVEADLLSGSLLTAGHALEQGRDIFAVPGSIFSERERGTHRLIRDGAKLTEHAQDIFDEYEYLGLWKNVREEHSQITLPIMAEVPQKPQKPAAIGVQSLPEGLSSDAKTVYNILTEETVTVDTITEHSGLDVSKVLTAVTELEIYGLVTGHPGRKFSIT